jgi:hypothetical protein
MLKTAFHDYAIGTTHSCFLDSDVGKHWLKILKIQDILPQPTRTKTWKKFAKSSSETDKISFWRLLAGQDSHMGHADKL